MVQNRQMCRMGALARGMAGEARPSSIEQMMGWVRLIVGRWWWGEASELHLFSA